MRKNKETQANNISRILYLKNIEIHESNVRNVITNLKVTRQNFP